MAIVVVQSQIGAANAASVTATFGTGATAGNTLVAFSYTNSGAGNPVISGFTRQIMLPYSGTAQSINFYTKIAAGSETAIQMTGGSTISRLHIAEISGLLSSITTDNSNTNTVSTVTSISTNSISTANANDIVFVCAGTSTGESGTQSWTNSFSTLQADATSFRLLSGYQIVSTTGSYSSTGTVGTTATNSGAFIIALQASSGATPSIIYKAYTPPFLS